MAVQEETVVVMNKSVLEDTLAMMKQLVRDMESYAGDVPYMFVYKEYRNVSQQLKTVYEKGLVKNNNNLEISQHVIMAHSDLQDFHRTFNIIGAWADKMIDYPIDLPHDRIPVWTGYVKQAIEYIEPYLK